MTFNKSFNLKKSAGLFEEPKDLYAAMNYWAVCRYFEQVLGRANKKETSKDLQALIKGIQNSNFRPANIISSISTKFPLSKIINWKYINADDKTTIVEKLKSKGWKDLISLALIFDPRSSESFSGQFNTETHRIKVIANADVLNIEDFNNEVNEIGDIIKHELTHLAQSALQDYKNLPNEPGSPFKKEVTPEDKKYLNEDTEFYPMLKDWILYFNRQRFSSKEDQEEYFKEIIGIKGSDPIDFFQALKEKEPEKWRKAIKELYKNIVWLG